MASDPEHPTTRLDLSHLRREARTALALALVALARRAQAVAGLVCHAQTTRVTASRVASCAHLATCLAIDQKPSSSEKHHADPAVESMVALRRARAFDVRDGLVSVAAVRHRRHRRRDRAQRRPSRHGRRRHRGHHEWLVLARARRAQAVGGPLRSVRVVPRCVRALVLDRRELRPRPDHRAHRERRAHDPSPESGDGHATPDQAAERWLRRYGYGPARRLQGYATGGVTPRPRTAAAAPATASPE